MPIRPEMADRYPDDWDEISLSVRVSAGWRCECTGQCGVSHVVRTASRQSGPRCRNRKGQKLPGSDWPVVLTVAHLNHRPEDCRRENLKAMCQPCHLRYDADEHARNARATRARKQGLVPLPGLEEDDR